MHNSSTYDRFTQSCTLRFFIDYCKCCLRRKIFEACSVLHVTSIFGLYNQEKCITISVLTVRGWLQGVADHNNNISRLKKSSDIPLRETLESGRPYIVISVQLYDDGLKKYTLFSDSRMVQTCYMLPPAVCKNRA